MRTVWSWLHTVPGNFKYNPKNSAVVQTVSTLYINVFTYMCSLVQSGAKAISHPDGNHDAKANTSIGWVGSRKGGIDTRTSHNIYPFILRSILSLRGIVQFAPRIGTKQQVISIMCQPLRYRYPSLPLPKMTSVLKSPCMQIKFCFTHSKNLLKWLTWLKDPLVCTHELHTTHSKYSLHACKKQTHCTRLTVSILLVHIGELADVMELTSSIYSTGSWKMQQQI